jgi:hypothetical protein
MSSDRNRQSQADNPPTRRKKKDSDFATIAYRVVQEATGEPTADKERPAVPEPTAEDLHASAVALGRRGGQKGGKARAAKLTADERREIAKKAAAKRWGPKR